MKLSSNMRIGVAFLVAPGVPTLILHMVGDSTVGGYGVPLMSLILAVFAYLAALLIGFPFFLFAERKNLRGLSAYVVLGALCGLLAYIVIFGAWAAGSWRSYPEHAALLLDNSLKSGLVAVLYGALASLAFWAIARWRAD